MSFTNDEVTRAQNEVETEFGISLSHELLYSLVSEVEKRKSGILFPEALRFSLNELHIQGDIREYYKKAVGKLFGSHGGRKAARNRKNGVTPKQQKPETQVGKIFVEKSGQFAFKI